MRLEVAGVRSVAWTCSPGDDEALAAGWLLADGAVRRPEDIDSLEVRAGPVLSLRVRLSDDAGRRYRGLVAHRRRVLCGLRHVLDCTPDALPARAGRARVPDLDVAATLLGAMYARADHYQRTGGLHVAALSDGTDIVGWSEDVGRHNAADRVIGRAWLDGRDLGGLGLLLSSRISAALALKAGLAGIGWIVSRSIPTTLAVEIAGRAGTAIVARAGGSAPRLFPVGSP